MRSKWSLSSIGEFCPFIYGKGLSESKRIPGNIKVYGSNGVVGTHSEALVNKPGIIIGRKGTVGAVHYSKNPFWPIDTTFYVTDAPHRDLRFTYYLLKYINLKNMNSDSAVPGLNRDSAHSRTIFIPELSEQIEIANILESLDKKIDLLGKSNKTLESIAQTIFKSWFVNFDPVRAKAEGRAPEGIDAETAALFPDSFEESELGLVPKGWGITTLNAAYEINPTRKLKKDELAPYLDMANVPTSGHHPDTVINRKMGSGSKFMNGDTLLARITPCLENGKTAFVDFLLGNQIGWGSTEFVVLRPKPPLSLYHGYLLSRHDPFREFAIQSMSGTSGRQRIQNDVLGRYPVVIPTTKINEVFNAIVTCIQEKITSNSAQIHTLAGLRDTLLPRLISGQLQLPDEVIKEDTQ